MILIYKRFFLLSLLLINLSFLAACGHKNPLLNNQTVRFMRENFFLRGADFPIEECADYYSGAKQNVALKTKCTQWTQEYYQRLMNTNSIPATASLEDLRDPIFWRQVKETQLSDKSW